jgi:hypothetical protein
MCYILRVCVSVSLVYKTRQAHALCHVVTCDLSGSTIFFQFIAQTTRCSGKTIMNIQRVFSSSVQLLSETFLVLRIIERHMNRTVYRSFSIRKILNYQISRKPIRWESSCSIRTYGRTGDGRTDMKTHMECCISLKMVVADLFSIPVKAKTSHFCFSALWR